jgi:hypothetical protein
MIGYGTLEDDGDSDVSGVALDAIEDAPAIALNSAQIQAAQAVALAVSSGEMPRSNGVELVVSMGVPRDQAEKIVPAEGKKKAE